MDGAPDPETDPENDHGQGTRKMGCVTREYVPVPPVTRGLHLYLRGVSFGPVPGTGEACATRLAAEERMQNLRNVCLKSGRRRMRIRGNNPAGVHPGYSHRENGERRIDDR